MAGNEKIIVELILKDKDFQKGIKDAVKDTQNLGKQGKSSGDMLATGFKAAAAAAAAIGLKELVVDLAKTAATAQSVESAFANSFDPSVLKEMRRAVNGTVDDISLMQKALNAKNLRIPIETMNAGLRLAKQRAAETGESVEFLAQSVVLGLGRESALILDNLGISAKRLSDESQRTGDFMKAAAKIINDELANAPDTIDDLADSMAQAAAETENLKVQLAKELTPTFNFATRAFLGFLRAIQTNPFEDLAWHFKGLDKELEELNKEFKVLDNSGKVLFENEKDFLAVIDATAKQVQKKKEQQLKAAEAARKHAEEQAKLNKSLKETLDLIAAERRAIPESDFTGGETTGAVYAQLFGRTGKPDFPMPEDEDLGEGYRQFIANQQKLNEELSAGDVFAMNFADTMVDGLYDAIAAGEDFGETMRNVIASLLKDITKAIIKMAILNSLFPTTGGVVMGASRIRIPGFASGTNMFGGGLTLVGEYGPELVSLPGGSSIASASKTAGMMGGGELYSKISGEDIYLSSKRYAVNRQR